MWAKEPILTAIEIYDSASGASYIQISDVLINGKAEMRACKGCTTAPLDKDTYNKLPKITLGPGATLERGQDGVLRYTDSGGATTIVVPVNAKFEGRSGLSPADLADQARLSGVPAAAPPLDRGVTLVFVTAPDQEFAEYLRAKRANDIPGWQSYLSKYPSSIHKADADQRLARLLVASGEASLAAYDKTAEAASPSYRDLKAAWESAEQARLLSSSLPELTKLDTDIGVAQSGIVDKGRMNLDAYRAALKARGVGYAHLAAAKNYADISEGIASTTKGQGLESDVMHDLNAVESALRQAESSSRARQFDDAMSSIALYRSFADEEPRIAAVVDAAYGYHLERGKKAVAIPDWPTAIAEFTKAGNDKDTSEDRDLLANAREQLVIVQDKQAAAKALDESKEYEDAKDILHAYEALDSLPLAQRNLVTADIERLQPAYVQRAQQYANELRKAHASLNGPGDEAEIERAYVYLDRAYKLSEDESYRDRRDVLGDELSTYLLKQAQDYLKKPNGSGSELSWTYLAEALPYKATNIGSVRDAMQGQTQQHAIRSKLSIRVQFRDQTSQSESAGFPGQLENAVIAGLESSKIQVKVVRAGEVTPVDTDYQLAGDVLRHHTTNVMTPESVESEYLVTTERLPNEEWNKINRDYEKAQTELKTAQDALEGAEAKGNKGQEKDWKAQVVADEKKVEDIHTLLDATAQTLPHDVTRTYSYTRKKFTLTSSIQLRYAIVDTVSGEHSEMVPIAKEDHTSYDELEGVSPADTKGPKQVGASVDEGEFKASVENSVIDALVDSVRKQVEALPPKIYKQAKQLEDSSDTDGAGEAYLHYIEISPPDGASPEQKHAREFLLLNFNLRPVVAAAQ